MRSNLKKELPEMDKVASNANVDTAIMCIKTNRRWASAKKHSTVDSDWPVLKLIVLLNSMIGLPKYPHCFKK